jgi:hypothetical protein
MANGDQSRQLIVEKFRKKRYDSGAKKARRKYRKLEEEKVKGEGGQGDGAEGASSRAGDETPQ